MGVDSSIGAARTRLTLAVSVASALGLGALWYTGWLERQPGMVVEAMYYPILAWLLASMPSLHTDIARLPFQSRRLLLALTTFVVLAQFAGGGGDLYPGARWAMFSDEVSEPRAGVIAITTHEGELSILRPEELFGSLRNGRAGSLTGRLDSHELDNALATFAERYERLNPDVDVKRIEVMRLSFDTSGDQLSVRSDVTHAIEIP